MRGFVMEDRAAGKGAQASMRTAVHRPCKPSPAKWRAMMENARLLLLAGAPAGCACAPLDERDAVRGQKIGLRARGTDAVARLRIDPQQHRVGCAGPPESGREMSGLPR